MTKRIRRRRAETRRALEIAACAHHLEDLKAAHGVPPADVVEPSTSVPKRIEPPAPSSYCTSPAKLCSELIR